MHLGGVSRGSTAASATGGPVSESIRYGYRRDIQYLRALAVGLVVLYHFWPQRLPGGFIGVDVFFVISGYLITSHLVASLEKDGRVRILQFWARRIRRLLPASLVVLAVSFVCAMVFIPPSIRGQALREIMASTLYVQNWLLASDSVDYLASTNQPSLVQHFWSLSVEEQFYVVWPLLLALAGFIAVRLARSRGAAAPRNARLITSIVLAVIAIASFIASVLLTSSDPTVAYFATTTRAWEFAAGGLIASVGIAVSGPRGFLAGRPARAVLRIAGLVAVLASAFLLSGQSAFPGWIAIVPVAGSVLVIWAGIGATSKQRARTDPLELIGDRSYSIYLLHWPILIVAPYVLGHELDLPDKLLLLVLVLVLAKFSKDWIEDPARSNRWLSARVWRTFVAMLVAICLLVAGSAVGQVMTASSTSTAATVTHEQVLSGINCFGADALIAANGCADPFAIDDVDTAFARNDRFASCILDPGEATESCVGGTTEKYTHTLALVGDSHAAAVAQLVFDSVPDGWRVITYFATGCPGITREAIGAPGQDDDHRADCAAWSSRVLDELTSRDDIDAVLFTNFTSRYADPGLADGIRMTSKILDDSWKSLEAAGKRIIVLRDIPVTAAGDVPACIDAAKAADPCATPRAEALGGDDPLSRAAKLGDRPVLDLTDHFCDETTCHAVVGDVIVYSDDNHLTRTYASTLVPFLTPQLAEALR